MKVLGVRRPFRIAAAVALAVAVVAAIAGLVPRCSSAPMGARLPDGSLCGNTPGNVLNWGTVNAYDGWIYGESLQENLDFCRMRADGSEKEHLDHGSAKFVSMHDGWVYYLNNEYRLCRMRPNGEGFERVTAFDGIFFLNVVDGWMYFRKGESNDYRPEGIWKMRADGTGMELLYEGRVEDVAAFDGWVYFFAVGEKPEQQTLCRVDFNGGGLQELSESARSYVPTGDWIFYREYSEEALHEHALRRVGYRGELYKMKLDGSEPQKVSDSAPFRLNAWGDWVYFIEGDFLGPVYRVNVNTSEQLLVTEKVCEAVYVMGDRILFLESQGDPKDAGDPWILRSYVADPDGSNAQLVDQMEFMQ